MFGEMFYWFRNLLKATFAQRLKTSKRVSFAQAG
jgi:hypothetical protein